MRRHLQRVVSTLVAVSAVVGLVVWSPAGQAADADAEAAARKVTELLSRNFYEIEFFVFERSDVMEFNTREVLVHRAAQPYPDNMLALRSADEPYGQGYLIDASTRLCLTYPTLVYTVSDSEPGESPAEQAGSGSSPDTPAVDTRPDAVGPPPQITPELVIDPAAELHAAVTAFEAQLLERSDTWADSEHYQLDRAASRLRRRGNGRILFHGRWLQAVPERNSPLPVFIQGGSTFGNQQELNGSVGVTLGRYLHFQARLNYTAPALGQFPTQLASRADGSTAIVPTPEVTDGFMTLVESRRMRSGELHYLDHPKLGIVVRIDPVTIPQSLIDLQLALEERTQ